MAKKIRVSGRVEGGSGFCSVGDLDPDPNMHGSTAFDKPYPDPPQREKLNQDPHQSQKQDPNLDLDLHDVKSGAEGRQKAQNGAV